MPSPRAAPRPWPTCRGPVGLADTNSTLIFSDCAALLRPYPVPSPRIRRTRETSSLSPSQKLMNPGPAISVFAIIPSGNRSSVIRRSASFRGLVFCDFATTMARLVARSPWSLSRGRSSTNSDSGAPKTPATRASSARMASFTFRWSSCWASGRRLASFPSCLQTWCRAWTRPSSPVLRAPLRGPCGGLYRPCRSR